MKIEKSVKKETLTVLVGTLVCCGVLQIVFLLLKKYDYTVLTGSLLGGGAAVLNFFLLGLTVQKAVSEGMSDNAKKKMQISYTVRLLLLGAVLCAGILLPYFNTVATIVSAIFPRIVIFVRSFMLKKEADKTDAGQDGGEVEG